MVILLCRGLDFASFNQEMQVLVLFSVSLSLSRLHLYRETEQNYFIIK